MRWAYAKSFCVDNTMRDRHFECVMILANAHSQCDQRWLARAAALTYACGCGSAQRFSQSLRPSANTPEDTT
jgi:hypothetical protein